MKNPRRPGRSVERVPIAVSANKRLAGAQAHMEDSGAAIPPIVTGVQPPTGGTTGGTSVVITGTALTGATGVNFGATSAETMTVDSDTEITAVSPSGTGTVDIIVTTPAGQSEITASDRFSYVSVGSTVTGSGSV